MAVRLKWHGDKVKRAVRSELRKNMTVAVEWLDRQIATRTLTGQRSGRTYSQFFYIDQSGQLRAFGERPSHTASAPGEAPARDDGTLASSIASMVRGGTLKPIVGFVGTNLIYGLFLELGTEGPAATGGMEPRPWLMPTVRENRDELTRIITRGL